MKIIGSAVSLRFQDVAVGEVFRHNLQGCTFMKIAPDGAKFINGIVPNCVTLENGRLTAFNAEDPIFRIFKDTELHLK